jgi:hypothetical protein
MVEIDLPGLSGLNDSMTAIQYWFTVAAYVFMGLTVLIVVYLIYKILTCGACLVRCMLCPCRSRKKPEETTNLLKYEDRKTINSRPFV